MNIKGYSLFDYSFTPTHKRRKARKEFTKHFFFSPILFCSSALFLVNHCYSIVLVHEFRIQKEKKNPRYTFNGAYELAINNPFHLYNRKT